VPDLIGLILWPLKWLVELVLVSWHALFTFIGLPAAAGITWVLAIVATVVILKVLDFTMGLRVSEEAEMEGLDVSQHGEEGYLFT